MGPCPVLWEISRPHTDLLLTTGEMAVLRGHRLPVPHSEEAVEAAASLLGKPGREGEGKCLWPRVAQHPT